MESKKLGDFFTNVEAAQNYATAWNNFLANGDLMVEEIEIYDEFLLINGVPQPK